jgi:integrase
MKAARGLGNVYQPTYVDKRALAKYLADGLSPEDALKKARKTCATWWVVFHINGRRIQENAHSTNRADAVRLLKKKTGDAALGLPVGPSLDKTTLDDLIAMVETDYAANSQRSGDRVKYAAAHLKAFFQGFRKARDITTDRITAYRAHRLEAGAKPSTVNYEMAILRRGFRLGVKAGKVGVRPEFSMLHVDNARKGFFELEQHRSIMTALPDYLRPVAAVAYITGWRAKSELLTRQWRHVDFNAGWLRLEPGESKNGEGRDFPFTAELRTILEAQRERVRAIERSRGCVIPWVFCHADGGRIKDFRSAWAQACDDAGVPGRLVHDFRRTAVRNLERAQISRSAAMKMTGHKTEAVYRRYAIVDSAMLQEAALKLSAFHSAENSEKRQSHAKVTAISATQ